MLGFDSNSVLVNDINSQAVYKLMTVGFRANLTFKSKADLRAAEELGFDVEAWRHKNPEQEVYYLEKLKA